MSITVSRFARSKSRGWFGTVWLLAAVAVTAPVSQKSLAQSVPQAKPVSSSGDSEDKDTWQSFFKSFETRWRDLLDHPQKRDRSKWSLLENDLRGNAKKYKQELETEFSKPMTGATAVVNSTFTVPCLSQYDRPGGRCFMFPDHNGDCRYLCVPIPKERRE